MTPVEALEKLHPSGGAARTGKDAQKDMLWLSPAAYTRDREIAKIYILHHSRQDRQLNNPGCTVVQCELALKQLFFPLDT